MYNYKIIHIVEEHLYSYCLVDMEIRDIKQKYSVSDKDINSWIKSKGKVNRSVEIIALKNIEMEEKIKNKIHWKILIDKILKYYEENEQEKYWYIKYKYFEKCSTTKIERKMAISRPTQARIKTEIIYYIALYGVKENLLKIGDLSSCNNK